MDLLSIRKAKQMTQCDVAHAAGISRVAYTNIQLGKRRPSTRVAKRIANVLGISWTSFYEDGENDNADDANT